MIQVYTGNGKGKTTAALGLIVRALGCNKKVCLIQFMKKNFTYGEIQFLSKQENMDIFQYGTTQLINPEKPDQIDFDEAMEAYRKCKEVLTSNQYDVIVIDEINIAVKWKLISWQKQLELMEFKTKAEIIMTGRDAHAKVIEKANLVTEMKNVKHYFRLGVEARKGIES
ncbi:MAG: cob(I)yrinic acid a,c-diamide adenosyltransferase [Candidatus Cloacimonetes bacterium]|nr:cob(I)yrinic acid a,c-diamide adenosyltransferase [Candidatus Cloacimonadota bacterium]